MIDRGVARGQVRETPRGERFRVTDVWKERLYDGARCSVVPEPGFEQPRPVYRAVYSTSHVSRWRLTSGR